MKIGFELEIDNVPHIVNGIPLVSTVEEGSLRNGIEYVTDPLPDTEYASNLYSYLYNNVPGTYTDRCGFHFHMDFSSKSIEDITKFITRYITIERTLFRLHPELFRSGNNFCNLLTDSPAELSFIRKYRSNNGGGLSYSDFSKYTALNIKPLSRMGTIEFRAVTAGLQPEAMNQVFDIFNKLYDLNAAIPLLDQVTEADLAEANVINQLINTAPDTSPELGDYMDEHFALAPVVLTRESIISHIRGLS